MHLLGGLFAAALALCGPLASRAEDSQPPPATLLETLEAAPYVTPPTLETTELAVVVQVAGGYELRPLATDGPPTESSITAWLRRHRTMGTTTWFVAFDKASGKPVYWAPLPDNSVVVDEIAGRAVAVAPGGTGVVIPYDSNLSPFLYSVSASKTITKQALSVKSKSSKAKKGKGKKKAKPSTVTPAASTFALLNSVVSKTASAAQAIDLVFLPAGFTDTELDCYRSAVAAITTGLLDDPAFHNYADRFNVWRMDLVSAHSSGTPACDSAVPPPCTAPPAGTTLGAPRPATAKHDFGLVAQKSGPTLYWFDNESTDFTPVLDDIRAILGHPPNLVLVLDNDLNLLGGGRVDGGIAVAAVRSCPNAKATDYHLTSHELGHALGLYDEREPSPSNTIKAVTYLGFGPNIISADDHQTKSPPVPAEWLDACGGLPCNDYVRGTIPCPERGTISSPIDHPVGLWHGANFDCGFYAPIDTCRMNSYSSDPFCPVCAAHISDALAAGRPAGGPGPVVLSGSAPGGLPSPPPTNLGGSHDSIARVAIGEATGEVVARCFQVSVAGPSAEKSTKVVSAMPKGLEGACALDGERIEIAELLRDIGRTDVQVAVTKVVDDVAGRTWDKVQSVNLFIPAGTLPPQDRPH